MAAMKLEKRIERGQEIVLDALTVCVMGLVLVCWFPCAMILALIGTIAGEKKK